MEVQELDDLDYYHLPEVAKHDLYELGDCFRSKDANDNQSERMVLEVNRAKNYYLYQTIETGGKAGLQGQINIKEAHFYYERA